MEDKWSDLTSYLQGAAQMVGDYMGKAMEKVQEYGQQAQRLIEAEKLEGEVKKLLQQIGENVYDTHCGKLTDSSVLLQLLEQIDQRKEKIEALRQPAVQPEEAEEQSVSEEQSVPEEPAEEKAVVCSNCGQAAQAGDCFCRNCGAPLT